MHLAGKQQLVDVICGTKQFAVQAGYVAPPSPTCLHLGGSAVGPPIIPSKRQSLLQPGNRHKPTDRPTPIGKKTAWWII